MEGRVSGLMRRQAEVKGWMEDSRRQEGTFSFSDTMNMHVPNRTEPNRITNLVERRFRKAENNELQILAGIS